MPFNLWHMICDRPCVNDCFIYSNPRRRKNVCSMFRIFVRLVMVCSFVSWCVDGWRLRMLGWNWKYNKKHIYIYIYWPFACNSQRESINRVGLGLTIRLAPKMYEKYRFCDTVLFISPFCARIINTACNLWTLLWKHITYSQTMWLAGWLESCLVWSSRSQILYMCFKRWYLH